MTTPSSADDHPVRRLAQVGRVSILTMLGAGALVFVVVVWAALRTSPDDGPSSEAPASIAAQAGRSEPPRHAELPAELLAVVDPIEVDDTRDDDAKPEPTASVAVRHVDRPENPFRRWVAPEVFEEKYANQPLSELRSQKAAIEAEFFRESSEASDAFFNAGRGEVSFTPKAESLEKQKPHQVEETWGLIHIQRTQGASGGNLMTERGRLEWQENISLYDRQDELFWLISEIRTRGSSEPGGQRGDGGNR